MPACRLRTRARRVHDRRRGYGLHCNGDDFNQWKHWALPDGTFLGSSYDPMTGAIGAGTFKFPQTTVTNGSTSLTYQLSQTDTSIGQVDGTGAVLFSNAAFSVQLINGNYSGVPAVFGPSCVFEPIDIVLAGSASPTGLDLTDPSFAIPPTTDDCNGWAGPMNGLVSTSSNSIHLQIDGDFTPPDTIFMDGFEPPR